MKKKVFTIIILLFFTTISGQLNKSLIDNDIKKLTNEKIFIHYNSPFLISGESLLYKIYCLNKNDNSFSKISKIAYVELIDSNNKSIVKQKINLKMSTGNSDIFIDPKIKTGTYKLISYTKWMHNTQNYFEENIFIVNPFSLKNNFLKKDNILTEIKEIKANKTYDKREKISLKINEMIKENNGNYSISIRKKNNDKQFVKKKSTIKIKNIITNNNESLFLPELRGTIIKGKITPKQTNLNIDNIKLGLSFKDNNISKTSTTNNSGEFYFNIESIESSKGTIQLLEDNKNYNIEVYNNNKIQKKFTNFPTLSINYNLYKRVQNKNIFSQIENSYYDIKKDSILKQLKEAFFTQNRIVYKLDDYKRFKTIKETFIEIIELAYIKKKKNNYKLYIHNEKEITSSHSLLIIDGAIIHNHNDFIDFDSKKINTISIIKDDYFYGNGIYQGVIFINTFKENYSIPQKNGVLKFKILSPQKQKKYFFQEHNVKTKRIPDYRTQLYWNPNINLTSEKQISFFTSDVSGVFEIEIEGFTNSGKPISYTKNFTVK